ncbi:MAG: bifunctional isocitrate dehydrogenase kinase/phosphatase [Lautropia sp.]|nr:bifunctional isocitrate dehydrogenase kinase/phosphatase [Lautropia sp.]
MPDGWPGADDWRPARAIPDASGIPEGKTLAVGAGLRWHIMHRDISPRPLPPARDELSARTADSLPARLARTMLAGFNRHYGLFRYNAQQAKHCFECGDWHGMRRLARERITFYDQRVQEAIEKLRASFDTDTLRDDIWADVKRHYVMLLANHQQPELAESFFNTVSTQLLARQYFHNTFIFVRPGVSTEHLDATPPSFRAYYPQPGQWHDALRQMLVDYGLACGYQDIEADLNRVIEAAPALFGAQAPHAMDCQIHVLRSLFYRNKGAYLIGRVINDGEVHPFAIPLLRDSAGRVFLDTVLTDHERIEALFNFSRAYFMVDMAVPSAYVRFLQTLMPTKPPSELYTMLGLHKQGKTLFFRDLLQHLHESTDQFIIAPGIRGLVMGVFTLPSFPYVFKYIKDVRRKDISREYIEDRYQLVKNHDRVGRMADSWEYSDVPFPRHRLSPELLDELRATAPSLLQEENDRIIIRHLYIERRMIPLNIYIEQASEAERERAIDQYGQAIKDMIAANIFPGDMLYKNFGVTRQNRVVFYDYDEVLYLTDCNFRKVPEPRTPEDEMASEPWYPVAPNDVFPEEFGTFLLGNPKVRPTFLKYHADLLDPAYWQQKQARIRRGILDDVFPYPTRLRFPRADDGTDPPPAGGGETHCPG